MAKSLSDLSQDDRKTLLNALLEELTGGRAGAKMVSSAVTSGQGGETPDWTINFGCGKEQLE